MSGALNFSIQPTRLNDVPAIWELEKRVWKRLSPSRRRLQRRFSRFPSGFLVARVGAELGGFCIGVRLDSDARDLDLDESFPPAHVPNGTNYGLFALTVNPVFRRKGIASRLVKQQLALAGGLGCHNVQLIANAFSRPIFERLGFGVVERLEHLFSHSPELMPAAVLMEKKL